MSTYVFDRTAVDNLASVISNDWYSQACRNRYEKFFLWYRTAKPDEKVAIPIVGVSCPAVGYVQDIQISNAWTKSQAAKRIAERLNVLPILGA